MLPPLQQRAVELALLALAAYFLVQAAKCLLGYWRYRRRRETALLTWPPSPPALLPWLYLLGLAGGLTAGLNVWAGRPWHHVAGLALMAIYFLGLVPVARRIRLGFYRDGVWARRGFLPWQEVSRIAFVEGSAIVLLLQPRRGGVAFELAVPAEDYGAARKILEERARAGALHLDPSILGLRTQAE